MYSRLLKLEAKKVKNPRKGKLDLIKTRTKGEVRHEKTRQDIFDDYPPA